MTDNGMRELIYRVDSRDAELDELGGLVMNDTGLLSTIVILIGIAAIWAAMYRR